MTDVTLELTIARRFLSRARGLLFSRPLAAGHGLLLPGVSAVHGLLMNRPLDLAYLRDDGRVLAVATLAPGRLHWCRGAAAVVELEAGQLAALVDGQFDEVVELRLEGREGFVDALQAFGGDGEGNEILQHALLLFPDG